MINDTVLLIVDIILIFALVGYLGSWGWDLWSKRNDRN